MKIAKTRNRSELSISCQSFATFPNFNNSLSISKLGWIFKLPMKLNILVAHASVIDQSALLNHLGFDQYSTLGRLIIFLLNFLEFIDIIALVLQKVDDERVFCGRDGRIPRHDPDIVAFGPPDDG